MTNDPAFDLQEEAAAQSPSQSTDMADTFTGQSTAPEAESPSSSDTPEQEITLGSLEDQNQSRTQPLEPSEPPEPPIQPIQPSGKITTPLPESGGPPSPPLAEGTVLADRYQVITQIGVVRDTNLYRVSDTQGYRRCWACGSDSSMPGDIYCVECGAQLAGRYYRLQEFNPTAEGRRQKAESRRQKADDQPSQNTEYEIRNTKYSALSTQHPALPLASAILENRVPGLAHVYQIWLDPDSGRGYVAWEEASGRILASWLPGANPTDYQLAGQSGHLAVPQQPEEDQAICWLAQAAELLAHLHEATIAGCSLDLANLMVQPGDRLVLLDPSGCVSTEGMDEEEKRALETSDVRALAAQLEQWYMAVRKGTSPNGVDTEAQNTAHAHIQQSDDRQQTANDQSAQDTEYGIRNTEQSAIEDTPLMSAYDVTGPLVANMNPSVVLSRAREGAYPTAEDLAEILRDLYEANKPLNNLKLWSGRASDIGRVRKINEDSVLTLEAIVLEHEGNLPIALYVVADGMGGHQSGEVASSIAIRTIGSIVNSSLIGPLVSGDPVARDATTCAGLLRHAVLEANRRISELARERHSDLGTTVVAALLIGNQLTVANVGDSRAYWLHADSLQVITHDHSLVMQLVAAGQIGINDIYTHPRRNEIYRALGDPRLGEDEVDIFNQRLRPGDGLLICSDGLWDFVRDPDIAAVLAAQADPQTTADALVDRANQAGGEDNISVIFARVLSSET